MKTVFLLIMVLGTSDDTRREVDTHLRFYDLNRCNYFASELARRYGNYEVYNFINSKDRVTLYCVPEQVDPELVEVY